MNLTEAGNEHVEALLRDARRDEGEASLYEAANATLVHHVNQALRAHKLFQRDKDYIVRNGEVVIVDEFTGRMMPGRRYSEGLHQALEAKEHVTVQPENVTLASITFQNYFRLYKKLAGMTGTAATEADEFAEIYKLVVVEIPTNLPVARHDEDDEVYRTDDEKLRAVVREIEDANAKLQPMLVGTTSIEKSEHSPKCSRSSGYKKIDFTEPNALTAALRGGARRQAVEELRRAQRPLPRAGGVHRRRSRRARRDHHRHQHGRPRHRHPARRQRRDAHPAGARPGRLAGGARRQGGRDPRRGRRAFKQKAIDAGGLYIIGTERHESRRIDNQLRGRSGRQGDPGRSKFFLSLQDDLMRIFGSERMDAMLKRLGLKEDEAIVHPWINKALEKAQQKVEARNFDIRKNILKFDNVMNDQRKVIFEDRRKMMAQESLEPTIDDMRADVIDDLVAKHIPPDAYPEAWDIAGLKEEVAAKLNLDLPVDDWAKEEGIADEEMAERLHKAADEAYAERVERNTPEAMRYVEKQVILQSLDHLWRDHLVTLDHLRQVIGWRGMAQRDPLNEYKSEAFELFQKLIVLWHEAVIAQMMRIEVRFQPPAPEPPPPMQFQHLDAERRRERGAARRARRTARRQSILRRRGRRHGVGVGVCRRRRARPQQSGDLGQDRPQRALPVRFGQEVQALPRAAWL